jgi:hypothetical protein
MKRKPKETFEQFLEIIKDDLMILRSEETWKEDFTAKYGYIWVRWSNGYPKEVILKNLYDHMGFLDRGDHEGKIYISVNEDKIRVKMKANAKSKAWQKIITARFGDKDNLVIGNLLNISFDLVLNEDEKEILKSEI